MNFLKRLYIVIATPWCWLFSWYCYVAGTIAYWILELNDNSEFWCSIWYSCYNDNMGWSSEVQDFVDGNGSLWPWSPALIEFDSDGDACFKGTSISVDTICELLSDGSTEEQILKSYPILTDEHFKYARERNLI